MPASRTKKIVTILCVFVVAVGAIAVPFFMKALEKRYWTHALSNGTELSLRVIIYAREHNGHLPKTLADLSPNYLNVEDAERLRFIDRQGQVREWLYYYSPKRIMELPKDYILLAAPIDDTSGKTPHRLVCYKTAASIFLPETDFLKQMRSRGRR